MNEQYYYNCQLEWIAATMGEDFDPTEGEGNLPDRTDDCWQGQALLEQEQQEEQK